MIKTYPKGLAQSMLPLLWQGIWIIPCQQVPSSNPLGELQYSTPTCLLRMPSMQVVKHPLGSPTRFSVGFL